MESKKEQVVELKPKFKLTLECRKVAQGKVRAEVKSRAK